MAVPLPLRAEPPQPADQKTTEIQGQVFNHFGAGVPGAGVSVARPPVGDTPSPVLATATTNTTGDFKLVISEAVSGKVVVSITAPGYAAASSEVEIDPDDDFPPFVDVELAGAGVINGQARDARNGKPLAGADVHVVAAFRQLAAECDEAGAFKIEGLLPGVAQLVVEAEGYGREQCQFAALQSADGDTDVELPPAGDPAGAKGVSLDEAGRLIVSLKPERVVQLRTEDDKGKPVGRVTVECLDESRQDFRTLATDADGRLTVRGLNFETRALALRLSHDQYVSSEEFDRNIELPEEPLESTHTLVMQPAGALTGKITDRATSQTLNGARVLVGSRSQERNPRAWSDFEGSYRITGVPPGRQAVTVHLADHAPEFAEVEIVAGQDTTLNVKLDPASSIRGLVTDASGEPIPSVHVAAVKWRDHETLGLQAMTGDDGRFIIRNAPADEFLVTLRHVRYEPLEGQSVNGSTTEHRFQLAAWPDRGPVSDVRLKVGDQAPEFELTTLDGRSLKLADLKGKAILLDFWATWCGPCVAEIPNVRAVHDAFGKRDDFVLIGVSLDQDRAVLEPFVKKQKMDWPQAVGTDGGAEQASDAYGVFSIPALFLIGPDGKIRAVDLRGPNIRAEVGKLLADNDML